MQLDELDEKSAQKLRPMALVRFKDLQMLEHTHMNGRLAIVLGVYEETVRYTPNAKIQFQKVDKSDQPLPDTFANRHRPGTGWVWARVHVPGETFVRCTPISCLELVHNNARGEPRLQYMKNIAYLKEHHPDLCAENARHGLLYGVNPYRPQNFAVISLEHSSPLAKLLIEEAWKQNILAHGEKSGRLDFCVVVELLPDEWREAERDARSAGYSSEMSPRSVGSGKKQRTDHTDNPYVLNLGI